MSNNAELTEADLASDFDQFLDEAVEGTEPSETSETSSSAATNNRAGNYNAAQHMIIIEKIKEAKTYKPSSTDSIWNTLATSLNRTPKILAQHWGQMIGVVKTARSNLGRSKPSDDEDYAVHEIFFRDLHDQACKTSAKSWWSVDVVREIFELQSKFERKTGSDGKQDADKLAELGKDANNKFAAETLAKKKAMEAYRLKEEEEKKSNKLFKENIVTSLSMMASSIAAFTTPASVTTATTDETSQLRAKVDRLENKVDLILDAISNLAGKKRDASSLED